MVKLALNCRQVIENVGMIELQIINRQGARTIVNKFGPFIKKCSVVLIGLNHKKIRITTARRDTKIRRHSTNEKARRHPCIFQYPGQHATSGGFAMSARHCQHPFAL